MKKDVKLYSAINETFLRLTYRKKNESFWMYSN